MTAVESTVTGFRQKPSTSYRTAQNVDDLQKIPMYDWKHKSDNVSKLLSLCNQHSYLQVS